MGRRWLTGRMLRRYMLSSRSFQSKPSFVPTHTAKPIRNNQDDSTVPIPPCPSDRKLALYNAHKFHPIKTRPSWRE